MGAEGKLPPKQRKRKRSPAEPEAPGSGPEEGEAEHNKQRLWNWKGRQACRAGEAGRWPDRRRRLRQCIRCAARRGELDPGTRGESARQWALREVVP